MTFSKIMATIVVCGVMATGAAAIGVSTARAFTGEGLAKDATINLSEARAIALKVFDGEIASEELEKEKGGSGLRYSFDIKKGSVVHEVGVDAVTGRILENSVEHAGSH